MTISTTWHTRVGSRRCLRIDTGRALTNHTWLAVMPGSNDCCGGQCSAWWTSTLRERHQTLEVQGYPCTELFSEGTSAVVSSTHFAASINCRVTASCSFNRFESSCNSRRLLSSTASRFWPAGSVRPVNVFCRGGLWQVNTLLCEDLSCIIRETNDFILTAIQLNTKFFGGCYE